MKRAALTTRQLPLALVQRVELEAVRIGTEPERLLAYLLRRAIAEKFPLKQDLYVP